jgi:hypothetical protein
MHHHDHFSVFDAASNSWEATWAALAQAAFALDAVSDDEAIAPLIRRVNASLREWNDIESQRLRLRTAALNVTARVRVADAALDHRIESLASVVIASHGGRDGARYKALFPEPHEDIVALGLDAEVPAATLVLAELEKSKDLAENLQAEIDPLRTALQVSNRALIDRGEVYSSLGALQARVEAWLDSASILHDHVLGELGTIAKNRGLPLRWVDALAGI